MACMPARPKPYDGIHTPSRFDVIAGGAGSAVNNFVQAQRILMPVLNLGLPDSFVEQGMREELLAICELDAQGIIAQAETFCA